MRSVSDYMELLKQLIRIPSYSKEENQTAELLFHFLREKHEHVLRCDHNVIVLSKYAAEEDLPTILLCSHHDTVKPNSSWTEEPFAAKEQSDGKIIGLGANDAGASLVSLIATFEYFESCTKKYPFKLILACVAEEEITGKNGLCRVLQQLKKIDFAIIGEPTQLKIAVAEKGLLVLDAITKGQSGHAARNEGINAIYLALEDISWIKQFSFEKKSSLLGGVNMQVTQIMGGYQHNVIPDSCSYTIDIRTNECYTHEEILMILRTHLHAELSPRSAHLRSSATPSEHFILKIADQLGISCIGSPTISDWCVLPREVAAIKMGPGNSNRSHQPNEYIYRHEIEEAIQQYIRLLQHFK